MLTAYEKWQIDSIIKGKDCYKETFNKSLQAHIISNVHHNID